MVGVLCSRLVESLVFFLPLHYRGDAFYRLCQEIVLGRGEVAILRAMGYAHLKAYHMNEGRSALLILSLLQEEMGKQRATCITRACAEEAWEICIFTTHTPVAAAMDQFSMDLARRALGDRHAENLINAECFKDTILNMTYLGLCFSHYINGVSIRHEKISHGLFPNYPINSITKGAEALARQTGDQEVCWELLAWLRYAESHLFQLAPKALMRHLFSGVDDDLLGAICKEPVEELRVVIQGVCYTARLPDGSRLCRKFPLVLTG